MAKVLTTSTIEKMKPDPVKRIEVPDPALIGLYLALHPSGLKTWALRYRFDGKPKKLTLGRWPIMGISDARKAASEAIEAVQHGDDPSAEKQATKAAKLKAQQEERNKVKTLIEQFDKRHLSALRTGKTVRRELDRFVVAQWGDRNIHEITKRDVIDLLDDIADSGRVVSANRLRSYLNKFLNWLVERDILAMSPATGVKPVAKEASRDRVLTDDEVRWFWQACDDLGHPWGPFSKMLLLTGQRLNEVAQMTEAEITGNVWHLSSDRTKNRRAHDVPLSNLAQSVLAKIERIRCRSSNVQFIFTTTGRSPVSGFHKGRHHIAKQMEAIASKERRTTVEIPKWNFHDLRRTAATGMARLGVPVRVTEAVLNHVSGTGGGIVAIYQRHDYASEKAEALEKWSQFVMDLIDMENPSPQARFDLPNRRTVRLDDAWEQHCQS
ncbi:tyrosine-type recombinase/integrase [Paracoccus saliphilus]|uniref:Integrase arm-type DNA-binding domain-containing protein n=1 Tax=Paracoccus saliphilus TaxID=405559 RepID=A0AA45W7P2_9RHOB|nr:site-specific integrase [Paracoccus saliphilus]WCR04762.1 integrase arm-type DNA-binding domain-containing protein [Paracoccus saliphilus]SIT11042.1 Site-specific recombinase XerD [Paracoccus saliphilus]